MELDKSLRKSIGVVLEQPRMNLIWLLSVIWNTIKIIWSNSNCSLHIDLILVKFHNKI